MSTRTCPNGHPSQSSDYCDVCGAPMDQSPAPDAGNPQGSTPAAAAGPEGQQVPDGAAPGAPQTPAGSGAPASTAPCPNCALVNTPDALFCESCGYDFTTGTMPREAAPGSSPDLGAAPARPSAQGAAPASVAPAVPVEWVAEVWVDPDWYSAQDSDEPCPSPGLPVVVPLRAQSLLIGRTSRSRNIHPEIECSADVGVSRRQAQLTTDGQRWWVEDLQSSNGTYVAAASAPMPTDPLPPGQRRELAQDEHIYVGAWTCVVVRRATPEEQAGEA
jgi:FHA domain